MSESLFWNLLAKKFAGEATPEDLAQLDELMRKHPDWMFSAQYVQDLWKMEANPASPQAEEAFAAHLQRMKQKGLSLPGEPLPPKKKRPWAAIGLGLLLLLSIPAYFTWNRDRG